MGTEKETEAGPDATAPGPSEEEKEDRLETQLEVINNRLLRLKMQVAALASFVARRKRGTTER